MNARHAIAVAAIGLIVLAGAIVLKPFAQRRDSAARNQRPSTTKPAVDYAPDGVPSLGPELIAVETTPPPKSSTVPPPTTRPTTRNAAADHRGIVGGALPPASTEPDDPPFDEPFVPIELARIALRFVGTDPEADEVWAMAINDPALSPDERKDLIEDLNEEGFPDPKNVTVDDLPLILSRIELIEELGPDAMDDTNAAAFAEAYKDLVSMVARLAREQQEQQ